MDDSELDITSRGQLVDDFKTRLMDIEKRLDCLPESTWFFFTFIFLEYLTEQKRFLHKLINTLEILRMALFDANPPLDSQMARYVETLRLVNFYGWQTFTWKYSNSTVQSKVHLKPKLRDKTVYVS